ncbi:MAG: zinc-binding dehydrogenase, partial [Proteobacteria bacterium]|nr:zinc-binding dehydrogenase [Pseudomonadota bacterium]
NGIDLSGIKPGQKAAVLGPGPIGLLFVQLLKAAGAVRIVVTGTRADVLRLDIAAQLGADVVIKADEVDPVKALEDTVGLVDHVFEATGIPQTISQGLRMVKNGGKVMVTGIHAEEASFDPIELVRKKKSLIGVYGYESDTWFRALDLLETGKVDIDPMITHRLPFSQYEKGFELACNKSAAKVILVMDE